MSGTGYIPRYFPQFPGILPHTRSGTGMGCGTRTPGTVAPASRTHRSFGYGYDLSYITRSCSGYGYDCRTELIKVVCRVIPGYVRGGYGFVRTLVQNTTVEISKFSVSIHESFDISMRYRCAHDIILDTTVENDARVPGVCFDQLSKVTSRHRALAGQKHHGG